MDTLQAFVKADDILRRCPHRVRRFQLKKVGENYYIFAHAHGLAHPTIVGRFSDREKAQDTFTQLEKTIKDIQNK